MPNVEVSERFPGDRKQVYDLICDMESYPRFMPSLNRLEVLERGEDWTITQWDASIGGLNFKWQERDEFDPEQARIVYCQTQGDLKRFEGEWRVVEQAGEVQVTLRVDFDFGLPMLSTLLNPVATVKLRQNGEAMLKAIRERCEAGRPQ